jgi:hypothetical protein
MQDTDEQPVRVSVTEISLRVGCSCGGALDRHSHVHTTYVHGMFAQGGKQTSKHRGEEAAVQSTRQRCRVQ